MRKSIIVVENFYPNPYSVREYALAQNYYFPYDNDQEILAKQKEFSWKTSWFKEAEQCPFKSSTSLIRLLENITGDKIDIEHWKSNYPIGSDGKGLSEPMIEKKSCLWNCSFHLKNDVGQKLGDGVHNHVVDIWNGVGVDGWAGVIYLTPNSPLSGGLHLWKNINPENEFDWMTPKENWILTDIFGNVFNRLILCRGNIPHSGGNGWTTDIHSGRLFQTFFFKIIPSDNATISESRMENDALARFPF